MFLVVTSAFDRHLTKAYSVCFVGRSTLKETEVCRIKFLPSVTLVSNWTDICGITGYQSSLENILNRINVKEAIHLLSTKISFLLFL